MNDTAQILLALFAGISLLILAANTEITYKSDKKDDTKPNL